MSLSAKRFEEIVATLETDVPKARDDKRVSSRVTMNTFVHVHLLRDGKRVAVVAVKARDFSPRGACIEFPRAMERGEQFVLQVPIRGSSTEILCTTIYCRPQRDGKFNIGAEFICSLDADRKPEADSTDDVDRIRQSILD